MVTARKNEFTKMAMLTSGEYTLIKQNIVHEKKSMLFVKLTDSAQRALDNYFRNAGKCEAPVIEFAKDEGRILIPTCDKDSDADKLSQFKFNVISNVIMQGRQGRFECVQHKRGNKQLTKFGQLTHRLRIHANEDVYETTKNRMAAIELEQRKNCTVQLDWSSQIKGKSRLDRLPKSNPTPLPKPLTEEIKPVPELANPMVRNKCRPVTSTLPHKLSASCLIRKSLKERIIHLLALRPYKKIELMAALKKDGLRECDKPHLMDTLMSLSTLRDNIYHLSKHAWNDVQEDWYFYSEQEKQQIKRNKSRNLTSPCSSDSGVSVSSNQSPNSNAPPAPIEKSPPSTYKRPGYFNGADGFQTKRQRISHFVKPDSIKPLNGDENAHIGTNNTCSDELNVTTSAPDRPFRPKIYEKLKPIIDRPLLDSPLSPGQDIPSVVVTSPSPEIRNGDIPISAFDRKPIFHSPSKIPDASEIKYQKPKYMKEYVTITSMEQRRKYKTDFNLIFKEYQRVHEEVDSISNTFAQLGESLRQHKKGTPKYAKIEQEILRKYYQLKSSQKFQAAKLRFEYLHEKLSHIKNLVHEYDEKLLKWVPITKEKRDYPDNDFYRKSINSTSHTLDRITISVIAISIWYSCLFIRKLFRLSLFSSVPIRYNYY